MCTTPGCTGACPVHCPKPTDAGKKAQPEGTKKTKAPKKTAKTKKKGITKKPTTQKPVSIMTNKGATVSVPPAPTQPQLQPQVATAKSDCDILGFIGRGIKGLFCGLGQFLGGTFAVAGGLLGGLGAGLGNMRGTGSQIGMGMGMLGGSILNNPSALTSLLLLSGKGIGCHGHHHHHCGFPISAYTPFIGGFGCTPFSGSFFGVGSCNGFGLSNILGFDNKAFGGCGGGKHFVSNHPLTYLARSGF